MAFRDIRRKFLLIGVSSAVLGGLSGFLLIRVLAFICRSKETLPSRAAAWIVNHIGSRPVLLLACAALFLLLFHWRTGRLEEEYEAGLQAAGSGSDHGGLRESLLAAEKQIAGIRERMQRPEAKDGE